MNSPSERFHQILRNYGFVKETRPVNPEARLDWQNMFYVEPVDALERLAVNMMVFMKTHNKNNRKALGLAAPQVGRSIQLIVFDCVDVTKNVNDQGFLFNPEVLSTDGGTVLGPEGCLSLPKTECQVKRAFKITVKYLGLDNQYHTNVYSGLAARIIQHEIDHLYGTLMTDIEEKV